MRAPVAAAGLLLLALPAIAQTPTPSPIPSVTPTPDAAMPDEWSGPAPAGTPWDADGGSALAVSGTTKSGSAERIRDAAAQVTLLTGEEIAVFGHRTLADLIENAPESFVGGDRTYPILGIRGFARAGDYNTRILLLLDGHGLNEPWNNYAPAGTDLPLDLTQVERVEILAGPVSALYGSNAFFGAVQIVTRTPVSRTFGGSLTGGSARYGRGAAWYGDGAAGPRPWSVLVSATGSYADGEPLEHDDLGTERETDWDRNGSFYVRATRGRLAVMAATYGRRRGVIGGAYDSNFGEDQSWTEDTHGLLDVTFTAVDRESVGLKLRAYGDAYRFEDAYRYDPDPVFHDRATSTWGGAEGVFSWAAGPNRLVVSVEESAGRVAMDAFERRDSGTTAPDPGVPPNSVAEDVRTYDVTRATVHDALQVGERIKLEAGVYAEYHGLYGLAAAPRAAVVAQLPALLTAKVLYGRGFRSPSIYERYYDDGDAVTGNEDLRAETADVTEIALEKSLGGRSDVFLSAFHGEYRDLMILETVDLDPSVAGEDLRGRFANGGTARSSGATLAFQTRRDAWVLWMDATGFRHDEETVRASQGAPEWVAHAVALVHLGDRVAIGARASGVGTRPSRAPGERLDPYVLADLSVRVALGGGLYARASGSNLLAADSAQPAGDEYSPEVIPGTGPRAFFEIRWEK